MGSAVSHGEREIKQTLPKQEENRLVNKTKKIYFQPNLVGFR